MTVLNSYNCKSISLYGELFQIHFQYPQSFGQYLITLLHIPSCSI